jgi:hypothetical protein
MTTPACGHEVTRTDGPVNAPCALCGPSFAGTNPFATPPNATLKAQLENFAADPAMEELSQQIDGLRASNPHAVLPTDLVSKVAAYRNRKVAAAAYKATGALPRQIVKTHHPRDDAA